MAEFSNYLNKDLNLFYVYILIAHTFIENILITIKT